MLLNCTRFLGQNPCIMGSETRTGGYDDDYQILGRFALLERGGKGAADGDWKIRGCNSNEGVTGCLKDRYLAIKMRNVNNYPDAGMYVTGFGVNVKGKVKSISKGTEVGFNWTCNKDGEGWYSSGLIHDDVKCIITKDKLNNF